jgi:hypothetical protein
MHNRSRNPSIHVGNTWDIRNNVFYNWVMGAHSEFSSAVNVNWVGNNSLHGLDSSPMYTLSSSINVPDPQLTTALPKFYIHGNLNARRTSFEQDEWELGVLYLRLNAFLDCAQPPTSYCAMFPAQTGEKPLFNLETAAPAPPVTTQDALTATALVLSNVGATRPARDAVDQRLVDEATYVFNTKPFSNTTAGYDPYADPNLRHVGANSGTLCDILWFKPQNLGANFFDCLPRQYKVDPGQTILDAKLEMLSRMECTFPDGLTLPQDAAAIIADPVNYQWEIYQAYVPDRALFDALYPIDLNPVRSQDSDGDAIPDAWELEHGTDPLADDSVQDVDGEGYLNIEEYLNGLAG